jgi:excisionase family DNA binding protein
MGRLVVTETITAVEAARMLGIHRATVVDLLRKGELKGHKKTLTRTSAYVVDRERVLDYDRRRREQSLLPQQATPTL